MSTDWRSRRGIRRPPVPSLQRRVEVNSSLLLAGDGAVRSGEPPPGQASSKREQLGHEHAQLKSGQPFANAHAMSAAEAKQRMGRRPSQRAVVAQVALGPQAQGIGEELGHASGVVGAVGHLAAGRDVIYRIPDRAGPRASGMQRRVQALTRTARRADRQDRRLPPAAHPRRRRAGACAGPGCRAAGHRSPARRNLRHHRGQ